MNGTTPEQRKISKIGLVAVCIFFIVVFAFAVYFVKNAPDWSSPEKRAINLVKNHVPSAQITTVDPLTIGDLVELEVKSLTMQGLQTRAVWIAVDNGNGWYVVTARFELIDPTVGWDEMYSITWGVNLDTEEIVGINTWVDV